MSSVPAAKSVLDQLSPSDIGPLVFVALFAIVGVIAIVASTLYMMHKNRLDNELKRELLDRGMSADEIATVVNAKPGTEK